MSKIATLVTETDPDFMNAAQLERRAAEANADNAAVYQALDNIHRHLPVLAANLHNLGMTAPACATTYRAVMMATGNVDAAWEATRREQLLWLRELQVRSQERYRSMRSDVYHFTVNHKDRLRSAGDRALEIQRIARMPNPFTAGAQA